MVAIDSHRRALIGRAMGLIVLAVMMVVAPALAANPTISRVESSAAALKPALRLSQSGILIFPMNPLPMCYVSKTSFGQPRPGGRIHEGTDLMASLGQEVFAVGNGTLIRQAIDGNADAMLSGNAWKLQLSDGSGTYYFYAHLSKFADGLKVGDTVTRGQVIGYVGDTGDAGPGNYHLHFEVHPQGGAAVDPFPLLTIPKSCTVYP